MTDPKSKMITVLGHKFIPLEGSPEANALLFSDENAREENKKWQNNLSKSFNQLSSPGEDHALYQAALADVRQSYDRLKKLTREDGLAQLSAVDDYVNSRISYEPDNVGRD